MNNYEIETEEYLKHGLKLFLAGLYGATEEEHAREYCNLVNPKGLIIDMGSGIGEMGALIKKIIPTTQTINVTNSKCQIEYMQRQNRECVFSDYNATPLPDGCADFVMFNESFGYGDANELIEETARLLKLGGALAIKDFNLAKNISTNYYSEAWNYTLYPISTVIKITELKNLSLEFLIRPKTNIDKCSKFIQESKLKNWHDVEIENNKIKSPARSLLYKFTKVNE